MSKIGGIEVVGFDLDNTLYPVTEEVNGIILGYIYDQIAERLDLTVEAAETAFQELYQNGAGQSGGSSMRALGIPDGSDIVQEALEHADVASVLSPIPEVTELLKRCREHFAFVDLITGSNKDQTTRKLTAMDINGMFDMTLTGEQADKSNGEAYRLWLDSRLGADPSQFLYVGDRFHDDHEIPAAMGIKTALVNVKKERPDAQVPQLRTIQELGALIIPKPELN